MNILFILRETKNMIVCFFKNDFIKDDLLTIPESFKKIGTKLGMAELSMSIVTIVFSFMLKVTNYYIEHKLIILGIIFFMLYKGQYVFQDGYRIFIDNARQKYDLIYNDEIVLRGSKIISKVTNRVMVYDSNSRIYKLMSNEAALHCIQNYLQSTWKQNVQHIFDVLDMVSVVIMLLIAIITNNSIPQKFFIPLLCFFSVASFLTQAYLSFYRRTYINNNKQHDDKQAVIVNDLLRVPMVVSKDLDMRISKFQKVVQERKTNVKSFNLKRNISWLVMSILEVLCNYGIIIAYIIGIDWRTMTLASIADISAQLLIVEIAIQRISSIARILSNNQERHQLIEREKEDMKLILEAYYKEESKENDISIVDKIILDPFSVRYFEESENDKPFNLISNNIIEIDNGDVAILYGPSGSGKSTFMKLITERIRMEKSTKLPSTSRFLFYDEKLRFGSLSLYEELFCEQENPDLDKMQEILENLHLWQELKANCYNVWQWMKEKQFEQALSNGQKQRLILAKLLYWLNKDIDVLVLDEATSGLDVECETKYADAQRVLEYLVRFANKDKKRIVIIATHQNIDGFKHNIINDVKLKEFYFCKEGAQNIVKEVN